MSIKLMTLAWDIPLPLATKFVLISLADQANDQNVCWPSLDYIADRCAMHRRTVQRAVGELEDLGFIKRQVREGRSTWYMFDQKAMKAAIPDEGGGTESRVAQGHGGGGVAPRGGGPVPPITTINPQLTLEAPPKPPKGGRIATAVPAVGEEKYSPEFEEFWQGWPKGKGGTKAQAYKSWLKLKLDDLDQQQARTLLAYDVNQRSQYHRQWLDGFVPHVATYLNQRQWTAPIDHSTGPRTNGRASTTYERIMAASDENRAALREDLDELRSRQFGH